MEKGIPKGSQIGLQIEALAVQVLIFEFLVGFEKTCFFDDFGGGSKICQNLKVLIWGAMEPKFRTGSAGEALAVKGFWFLLSSCGRRRWGLTRLLPRSERRGRRILKAAASAADP